MKIALDQIGILVGTDKASNHHKYLDHYDELFKNLRNDNINFLEVGILFGQSTKMFKEYFSNGTIYAFDIDDKTHLNDDRIKIMIGDQSNREFLNSFEDNFFDIILDDGSHRMDHQQISIGTLFKKLKSGGIYVLEDLHTSNINHIETKVHGLGLFNLTENGENNTISFLNGLLLEENGPNYYLTPEEYTYLKENVKSLEIKQTASRSDNDLSITSWIIKK